jgi:hypothetical protein
MVNGLRDVSVVVRGTGARNSSTRHYRELLRVSEAGGTSPLRLVATDDHGPRPAGDAADVSARPRPKPGELLVRRPSTMFHRVQPAPQLPPSTEDEVEPPGAGRDRADIAHPVRRRHAFFKRCVGPDAVVVHPGLHVRALYSAADLRPNAWRASRSRRPASSRSRCCNSSSALTLGHVSATYVSQFVTYRSSQRS